MLKPQTRAPQKAREPVENRSIGSITIADWLKFHWPMLGIFSAIAYGYFDLKGMVQGHDVILTDLKVMGVKASEQREAMIRADATRQTQLETQTKLLDHLLKRMDAIYDVRTREEARKGL